MLTITESYLCIVLCGKYCAELFQPSSDHYLDILSW